MDRRKVARLLGRAAVGVVVKSPEKGARTSIYLATSPDVANATGKYFHGTKVINQNPIALDDDNANRLWQITERLTATSTVS